MRIVPLVIALCSLSGGAAFAQAGGAAAAFDGRWAVQIACPKTPEGLLPISQDFTVSVSGGALHGELGTRGVPGWTRLDGTIAPDGSAALAARGLLETHAYAGDMATTPTPFFYHVTAQFGAKHGTGTRTDVRPCSLSFDRVAP